MTRITLFAKQIAPGVWRVSCPFCGQAHYLTGLGKQHGLCWKPTEFSQDGAFLVAD